MAVACVAASNAKASFYQMVLCAANNGSNGYQTATNTISASNPGGIFSIENYCGPAPFPAGNGALLRIVENQSAGNAGNSAYASVSWTAPPWVSIVAGGGYTRQPGEFRDGWRARFWGEGHDGSAPHNILMQGSGVSGGGIYWGTCSTFCSHLWPFGGWGSYRRFVYEMTCVRPAGCDRGGWNGTDANTIILTLDDTFASQVWLTNGPPLMSGNWVKGTQSATYAWTEEGSGIRFERLYIDGSERWGIDHIAAGQCNRDAWGGVGEFARDFRACPTASNIGRSYTFNTASIPDGAHSLQVCIQDYAQWVGLAGTGGQSCTGGTIRTDNSAPGAPAGLVVKSANPNRYLPEVSASFNLPPNSGSPITKVHYQVINASGEVVVPERVVSATNPTEIAQIAGPAKSGDYRLRLWLEDQVGHIGAASVAPIPRDTTPPAAPQDLSVTAPSTSRASDGFDLRWRNVLDAGSPISNVHYRVRDAGAAVVVPVQTVAEQNVQSIADLETPQGRGGYTLDVWLEDAEGNVGVPTSAPLSYDCVRSRVGGGTALASGLGEGRAGNEIVKQGTGSLLRGRLTGEKGAIGDAPICVFSRIVTRQAREFVGMAVSDSDGSYQFPVAAGPSRELVAAYRSGAREVVGRAKIETIVHPAFKAAKRVVYNKRFAKFAGSIPGPDNNNVVVVLQVRRGKGWLAFRRYRTREDGQFTLYYRFNRTSAPTRYVMRAQVRTQDAYPYLQGNSDRLTQIVLPRRPRRGGGHASAAVRSDESAPPARGGRKGGGGKGHPCGEVGFCG